MPRPAPPIVCRVPRAEGAVGRRHNGAGDTVRWRGTERRAAVRVDEASSASYAMEDRADFTEVGRGFVVGFPEKSQVRPSADITTVEPRTVP